MAQDFRKYLDFDFVNHKTKVVINKNDITKFVAALHDVQLDYIDEALELSDLSEANFVIKNIMEKK